MFANLLQNAIINGGFHFWQRNTTFASIADGAYSADRWKYVKVGTSVQTVSRSTDVPAEAITPYSMLITNTTAQAALGATGLIAIQQLIEGNFATRLYGKKLALSFWVKSSKVGTYCARITNSDTTRVLVREYTISQANTWEKKTIRFSHDLAGTWLKDTGTGLRVSFALAAGTNYNQAVDNQWVVTNQHSTTNQVNWVDTIGSTFQLSEVTLVEDNTEQTRPVSFVLAGRNYAEELQLCQRYFEKSYQINDNPGSPTGYGGSCVTAHTAGAHEQSILFKEIKRISPVVVAYNPTNGAINSVHLIDNGTSSAWVLGTSANANFYTGGTAAFVSKTVALHYTADSEL